MTDIALPPGLCPSTVSWALERNRAVEESPFSRVAQTQGRPGDRWRATVSWADLQGDQAFALAAWLDEVSVAGNHALIPAFQNDLTGTDVGTENFADLNRSWRINNFAGYGSVNLATQPFLNGGNLELFGNGAGSAFIIKDFAVTAKLPYLLMFDIPTSGLPFLVVMDDTANSLYTSDYNFTPGRRQVLVFPQTNTLRLVIYAGDGGVQNVHSVYGDFQLYRALILEQAKTAGSSLVTAYGGVQQLPNLSLKAGQFVGLVGAAGVEIKRVRRGTVMKGGAAINGVPVTQAGRIEFAPALRSAVAANSPILHHRPSCRMRLATGVSSADITPPLLHGFSVDFVEEL